MLKRNKFNALGMFKEYKSVDYQKMLWIGAHQEEENEVDLNLPGRQELEQCFSAAGPRPNTGPWHHLYRAARGSPGIDN